MKFLLSGFIVLEILSGCQCQLLDNLTSHLFGQYESSVRPQCKVGETVNVNVQIALRQIVELDEPKQLLNLNLWLRLQWHDCRLVWNASQFQGIDRFIIPQKRVWIPDMTLYDNSAAHSLPGMKDYNVKVSNNGKVQYNFPTVLTSLCAINVKFFPFDYQKCGLTFGSWAYPGSDINITSEESDTGSYVRNTEWEVLGIPFERKENFFPSLNESYPTITYFMKLKRKPLFYVMNMVFPCLLITFVATFGFMLPPDSGEKVNLSITVLLSLAVFQLIVLETIPASGDSAPYIGIFFMLSMVLVGFSCLMTVIVLKTHYKGNHGLKMPPWVRLFILMPLSRITCIKIEPKSLHHQHTKEVPKERYTHKNGMINNVSFSDMKQQEETPFSGNNGSFKLQSQIQIRLDSIAESASVISSYVTEQGEQSEDEREWIVLAQIFDRLFVVVYLCLNLIASITIMVQITGDSLVT